MTDKEIRRLRSLVPLHTLSEERFSELTSDVCVEQAQRGQTLFRQGDTDQHNVYLLDGQLALMTGDRVVEQVAAGSNTARFPIGHQLPRQYTAQALTGARFVRIDSRRLSEFLARDHTVDYQVNDLGDESANDDWMTQLLHSSVLQQIPAANIQKVMMRLEQLEVSAGETVLRQGEPGDFYYMLNRGKAVVTRDPGDGTPPVELARLGPGSAFGEEALLSNSPRNSTITMLTDGLVLRLSKQDFVELIHFPLSNSCDFETASAKVAEGAVWLDLRRPDDFERDHYPGSLNVPFVSLRYQLGSLAPERHYILVSDVDNLAEAAAFLLIEHGFQVSILSGGDGSSATDGREVETPVSAEASVVSLERDDAPKGDDADVGALRQRIAELERARSAAEAERQEALRQFKEAVDKARSSMQAVEQQRQAAIEERDARQAEAQQRQRELQELERERDDLLQRLQELDARARGWQDRLRKSESQGIAERDRAESADQRLEDLEKQVETLRRDRDLARQSHDQVTGALKEELTELQLELEQLRADNEELKTQAADTAETRVVELEQALSARDEELRSLRTEAQQLTQRLADLEQELQARGNDAQGREVQLAARDQQVQSLEQQLAAAAEAEALRAAELAEAKAQAARLAAELQATEETLSGLASEQEAINQERSGLEQELAGLRARQAEDAAAHEAGLAELRQQLDEAREALAQQLSRDETDAAQRSVEQEQREAELAGRLAAAEAALAEQRTGAMEETAQLQARLSAAAAAEEALRRRAEAAEGHTAALEMRLQELQSALEQGQDAAAGEHTRLLAALAEAEQDKAALQGELQTREQALVELRAGLAAAEAIGNEQGSRLQTMECELARLTEQLAAAAGLAAELEEAQGQRAALEVQLEEAQAGQVTSDNAQERLHAAEEQIADLTEQLATADQAYRAAESEVAELGQERAAANDRVTELRAALADARREAATHEQACEDARLEHAEELARYEEVEAQLRAEVTELRAVVEQYVEQIEAAHRETGDTEVLDQELMTVREQAAADLERLRGERDEARARLLELERSTGGSADALTIEALRQEVETLKGALGERQRELASAEQNRQRVEDQLEDAAREIERLRREGVVGLSELDSDAAPASALTEPTRARRRVDPATEIEELLASGLHDDRIRPPRRGIDADRLVGAGRGTSALFGLLVGLVLVVGGLELALLLSGRGELFAMLFGVVD